MNRDVAVIVHIIVQVCADFPQCIGELVNGPFFVGFEDLEECDLPAHVGDSCSSIMRHTRACLQSIQEVSDQDGCSTSHLSSKCI